MDPLLVWGLFPRLLGVVYLVAFASLLGQVVPMAGAAGVSPIRPLLRKVRSDYPLWRCVLCFPTLLWIRADDWCLRLLVVLGLAGAVGAIYGGPWAIVCLAVCWGCYLSLQHAVFLAYPWECLLLEAGFLALFLPAPLALPEWNASAAPLPAVGWAFRWLVFRMVFGFGKLKFWGTHRKELGYLRAFFVAVPLPSPLGWYGYHLPGWFMRLGLLGLFLIEVPGPFLVFVPGWPRLVAAAGIAGLMVAIQLTGNYGHFNLLMLALCLPLLDADAWLFDQPLDGVLWPVGHLLTHAVVLVLFVGGLIYLPANSWRSLAWLYRPSQFQGPAILRGVFAFYRLLAPFRLLHAYGVFPAGSFPAVRVVPVIEGTRDGVTWTAYPYRWAMAEPNSPPVWVAPHTPRLDHFLFYEALGGDVSGFLASSFSGGNPYLFARPSGLERLVQRLLEGSPDVLGLFHGNPFPDGPPTAIRVSLYLLTPTTLEERERTGAWWHREYLGPHLPPAVRDDAMWSDWLPEPELFHPDDVIWKLRTPRLRALYDRAGAGGDVGEVVADPAAGIAAEDVDRFWDDLVVRATPDERRDWKDLAAVVGRVRAGFSREQLRVFERVLGRLCLALYARLEPHLFEVETHFQLHLLLCHVIAEGRAAYEAVYRDPALAAGHLARMTTETGLFLTAVFWSDKLAYHARKFRLLMRFYVPTFRPGHSGFVQVIAFLAGHFEEPGEERYPTFARRLADGEWVRVDE